MRILDTVPFKVALVAASITTIGLVSFALTTPTTTARVTGDVDCVQLRQYDPPPPPPQPEPRPLRTEPPAPA